MEIQIIPTINVQSQEAFVEQLRAIEEVAPIVQIDIADGKFTNWENWHDPELIRAMNTNVGYELHLMVEEPRKEMNRWGRLENISRLIIHAESHYPPVETGAHNVLLDTMPTFFAYGGEVSVAINPETPVDILEPLMEHLYCVTLLGVEPGPSGQKADIHLLKKIEAIRAMHPTIHIEVDGGINEENIQDVVKAGADIICLGAALFKEGDPQKNYSRLKELAEAAL